MCCGCRRKQREKKPALSVTQRLIVELRATVLAGVSMGKLSAVSDLVAWQEQAEGLILAH
jgi:hypothetical protein